MFGPNTYFQDSVNINYSHRDKRFFDLFEHTRKLFSEVFNLENYDILFLPGSGTVGIEALFFSHLYNINMIGVDGAFKNRWIEMLKSYRKKSVRTPAQMFCLLETSCSETFYEKNCLVDAISGFPYYDIPKDTNLFITCLNKQLGSYIGISVVCVNKSYWNNLIDESMLSYLNLSRYKSYHAVNQTPSTAPTFIYEHLLKVLEKFDTAALRKHIDCVSDMIVEIVGRHNIIGQPRCPVITLKTGVIPDHYAKKYDLYGYWAGKPNYQLFTYSDKLENYEAVLKDLKENIDFKG
jgi:aspartate aminotransferase-like enzyme